MISCEDKEGLERLIKQEFPQFSEKEREEMIENLVKKKGAYTAFYEYNGYHISKIGIKYKIGDSIRGRVYYSTKYDNEELD